MIYLYVLLVMAASVLGNYDLGDVCPFEECSLENNTKFSKKPAPIKRLYFKNCSDLEVLKVTPNLERLHLRSCGSDFKLDVFPPMTDLDTFSIANCSISELQKYQFENVINLDWISLAGNSIETLFNETFHKLDRIKYLDLKNNLITDLPEDVFYPLENLDWLNLGSNNITVLPKDIFLRNTRLKVLSLHGNPLKIVNLDFPVWTFKLVELDLTDCEELTDLRLSMRLDNLYLQNSGVERLHFTGYIRDIIHENSKVTHADLSGTHFYRSFVQVLCDMPSLEWLDLSHSSRGSDSYFDLDDHKRDCTFPNLHYLNLSGNNLRYLPRRLPLFGPYLTTLDLSHNQLEEGDLLFILDTCVGEEGNFPNLRFLNMTGNKLKKMLPRFPLLGPNLTILDLSHNLLEDVSLESLAKTQNLQSLYLEGNRLSSFGYLSVCESLKKLKTLELNDNRFNSTFYGNMRKYLVDNGLSAEPNPQSETSEVKLGS